MGRTSIRRHARRAALASAVTLCAAGIAASAAQAQAPLTWASPVLSDSTPGTAGLTGVSCPSISLCVAVDDNGNVLSSTAPTSGTWSAPASIHTPAPHLTAVSCPSGTLCFAVDTSGSVYSSATPTSAPWTSGNIDGTTLLNGVSCPSSSLCVAVDNTGEVLASVTPGTLTSASWPALAVDGSRHITAVSCPTASLCAAVDNAGNILVSTSPTSAPAWHATPLTTSALTGVSCDSAGLCVAVAIDGSVYASANVTASVVTWSTTPLDPAGRPLSAVSCSDVGVCVLVDASGNAFATDTPAAGQPAWTQTPVDTGHGLNAVSCLSGGLCVAVDNAGQTVVATLPAPTVATGTGTASTQTTASVTATVNPNDATLSDCHFDYGPTTAYGASAPCTVVPSATGGSQSVVATLSGLSAGTVYHFRIVASSGVASAAGADGTFPTPAPLKANPSLSGTPAVGNTLTCKPNVTTTAAETVTFQWLSDTVAIPGATTATYLIAATDATHHLSCQVTISGDGASVAATSGFAAVPSQTASKIILSFAGSDKHGATSASVPVTCSPQASGNCTIKLVLTVRRNGKSVIVGSSTTKFGAGTTRTLSVSLNASGKRLLKNQHTLTATLTVSGTILATLNATLRTAKVVFGTKNKHAARHAR